jgi:hypothetical protein
MIQHAHKIIKKKTRLPCLPRRPGVALAVYMQNRRQKRAKSRVGTTLRLAIGCSIFIGGAGKHQAYLQADRVEQNEVVVGRPTTHFTTSQRATPPPRTSLRHLSYSAPSGGGGGGGGGGSGSATGCFLPVASARVTPPLCMCMCMHMQGARRMLGVASGSIGVLQKCSSAAVQQCR